MLMMSALLSFVSSILILYTKVSSFLFYKAPIIFLVPENAVYYSFVGSSATLKCNALHYSNLEWQTESGVVIQASHKYNFQVFVHQ